MGFREWLYLELIGDGTLDEDTYDEEDISIETLYQDTDIEEYDIENYRAQYREYCHQQGIEPLWDMED